MRLSRVGGVVGAAILVSFIRVELANSQSYTSDPATLYSLYIEVKRCWDLRRDAAFVLISDVEMRRAREAIKVIDQEINKTVANLDAESTWKAATAQAQNYKDRDSCKTRYGFLIASYHKLFPESNVTPKDF